jgi:hypothetical protein
LKAVWHGMSLALVLSAAAVAGEPPVKSPPPDAVHGGDAPGAGAPAAGMPATGSPAAASPDGDFIEFLGSDDVGDAALWAYLKKSSQRKDAPSAPLPQDAKQ